MKSDRAQERIVKIFREISKHPRPSGHEEKILEWLKGFARKQGWDCQQDNAGNILIRVNSEGASKTVCLQTHCDMVCEKTPETSHDFSQDPIEVLEDGGWLRANGTTLGADDGLGMAISLFAGLAEFENKPNLELLITVDEERGMTGAQGLDENMLSAEYLINLDSDESDFIIGCAGGERAEITAKPELKDIPDGFEAAKVTVSGLKGGHSGVDIHLGRANAVVLAGELLEACSGGLGSMLASFSGGAASNAIARDAEFTLAVEDRDTLECVIETERDRIRHNFQSADPNIEIKVLEAELPEKCISSGQTGKIAKLLTSLPGGPVSYRTDMPKVVESSCNAGICSFSPSGFSLTLSQRSSNTKRLDMLNNTIENTCRRLGFECTFRGRYPGWEPAGSSDLLGKAEDAFEKVAGRPAEMEIIHAGLECGIISRKYPGIQLISMGPELKDIHSPQEKVKISSIGECFEVLKAILQKIESPVGL
ncbi:beta-Ala-His dipeptidase [Sedimentisphaera salicampi]|uniref:beta-Ala-His dipeptidase n=1 Tax=Sedimentisphaera salicampi TaxID=1941349 RepID=UPI000B9B8733|nr:beta-Ala-His dipeptidase [Sedimentisphaera salicampi]OXU14731.1 Cytosol non-specific dipeptidase [Sedimentisphaera salicampi]